MIKINDYLNNVLDDFEEYLSKEPELCDLKTVNFNAGQVPNYFDIHIQQLYLLRYAFAYAFEYKCMYLILLEKYPFYDQIKVTSIGCGNMIDYWSLGRALKECEMQKCKIIYKGMDTIDWSYKFPTRIKDDVDFIKYNAIDILKSSDTLCADIYFFPKSISEFSQKDIEEICKCFNEKSIQKDTIHVMISLRSDEYSLSRDMHKSKQIAQAIIDNGFTTDDDCNKFMSLNLETGDCERKIRALDDEFKHPFDIVNLLKNLNENCAAFIENGKNCSQECENLLSRWPILNADFIKCQVLTFRRSK